MQLRSVRQGVIRYWVIHIVFAVEWFSSETLLYPFLNYQRLVITQQPRMNDQEAFAIAVEEAQKSFDEGGVPVSEPPIRSLF
jgi:hypothetical protein